MARRKSSKSKTPGLGMGLDALIKAKTRDEESQPEAEQPDIEDSIETEKPGDLNASDVSESIDSKESATIKPSKSKTQKLKSIKDQSRKSKTSSIEKSADYLVDNKSRLTDSSDDKVFTVTRDVKKNPRITLWSSRSAAVLRYLKKTQPEFSISKEASKLIEDAVKEKYPEIWDLFEDL